MNHCHNNLCLIVKIENLILNRELYRHGSVLDGGGNLIGSEIESHVLKVSAKTVDIFDLIVIIVNPGALKRRAGVAYHIGESALGIADEIPGSGDGDILESDVDDAVVINLDGTFHFLHRLIIHSHHRPHLCSDLDVLVVLDRFTEEDLYEGLFKTPIVDYRNALVGSKDLDIAESAHIAFLAGGNGIYGIIGVRLGLHRKGIRLVVFVLDRSCGGSFDVLAVYLINGSDRTLVGNSVK